MFHPTILEGDLVWVVNSKDYSVFKGLVREVHYNEATVDSYTVFSDPRTIGIYADRYVFLEKAEAEEASEEMKKEKIMKKYKEMPELKPNMVIVLKDKRVMLITQPDKDGCYMYELHIDCMHNVELYASEYLYTRWLCDQVLRVYGLVASDYPAIYMPMHDYTLHHIYKQDEESSKYLLWERPAVKEVTMAEVCEKFGCDVRIVKD